MKTMKIIRGGSDAVITLANGDKYDSTLALQDENGAVIFRSNSVNTDSTVGYKGGKLARGEYFGIVGRRWDEKTKGWNGKRVVKIFRGDINPKTITSHAQLTDADMIVPSEIPNPNHGGKKQMQYVQIHDGGTAWDFSHGCITVLNMGKRADFSDMMAKLADNEIIRIVLTGA